MLLDTVHSESIQAHFTILNIYYIVAWYYNLHLVPHNEKMNTEF